MTALVATLELDHQLEDIFTEYCTMRDRYPLDGDSVLASRLANKFNLPSRLILDSLREQAWEDRYLDLRTQETAAVIRLSRATSVLRHMKIAHQMQQRAGEAFETLEPRTLEEARRLAQTGVEIERLLAGQATQNIAMNIHQVEERIHWLAGVLNYRLLDTEKTD